MEGRKISNRLVNVDVMKCVAIFMVLCYHTTLYPYNFLEVNNTTYYLSYFFQTMLSPCVPLFFFINGYLLLNKEFDLKKHIIKSLRLIFFTFLWGAINIFFLMLIKSEWLTLKEFIKTIITWKHGWINHLWYMGALVCIYIFFPLLKYVFDNNRKIFIYFTVVCAILTFGNVFLNMLATVLNAIVFNSHRILDFNFFNIFNPLREIKGYTLVYFCVGGLMKSTEKYIETITVFKKNCIALLGIFVNCVLLFAIGVYFSNLSGSIWDCVWYGYDTIFTFINVILIFGLALSCKRDYKILRIVSCNTLGIYYMHEILKHLTRPYLLKVSYLRNVPATLIYAMCIGIVCVMISCLLRRIPIMRELVK